ncbi:polysaccharide deacetylase family protein [Clostridium thermarum]|uniref:polysaccharide deacetylase family protein n=1 Tax=Clostridium thermarum TaxID=1716543 RepID=UPI0013D404DF|nr:polysaccharide deacetylase family protein [Clostridium thermarum]
MNTNKLSYRKRKGSVRIFIFTIILFLTSFTTVTLFITSSSDGINLKFGTKGNEKITEPIDKTDNTQQFPNKDKDLIVNPNDGTSPQNTNMGEQEGQVSDNSGEEPQEVPHVPANEYAVLAEEVYSYGRSEGKKFAFLTFDDGPNTVITPRILKVLKEYDVHATFFVLGNSVDNSPQVLKQIIDDGHAIANHTYSHDYKILYPNKTVDISAFKEELKKTDEAISKALGTAHSTRVVRFPAGSFENWKKPMRDALVGNGMYYLDWNAENKDGIKHNVAIEEQLETVENYIAAAENSDKNVVLLMHDSAAKKTTADALPQILDLLISKGYEFYTIK